MSRSAVRSHLWMLGVVAIGAACNGNGESSTTTPSTAPTTTTTPTTTAPTTTTEVPLATECVEATSAAPRFEFADERVLDTFGPLSEAPSLQLKLHSGESTEADVTQRVVTTARIPGGVLLSADVMGDEQALLTAIDADGARRWTRCFDVGINMFVAPPRDSTPTQALTLSYVPQVGLDSAGPEWNVIDLASGATVGPLESLFDEQGVDAEGIEGWMLTWSADSVLFGPAQDAAIDITRDHLVRVDLANMSATSIRFPESLDGRELIEVQFGFTEAGDLAIVEYEHALQTPKIVYAQGEWQQGAAVRALLPPIRDGEVAADGTLWLVGIDPTGDEVWRVTDVSLFNGEGFRHAQSGDVTVMSGCASLIEFVCEQTMAGIDTATGDVLWTNADHGGVLAIGDGFALVTADDGSSRIMINTRTGELADPSQSWSPNEYYQGCCGEESHWVQRSGAVVIARFDDQVEVWYPNAVAPPTAAVPIP